MILKMLVMLCLLFSQALNTAQAQEIVVKGQNVKIVDYGVDLSSIADRFKQNNDGTWTDTNHTTKTDTAYQETDRDEWTVYLSDSVHLNLWKKEVVKGDKKIHSIVASYVIENAITTIPAPTATTTDPSSAQHCSQYAATAVTQQARNVTAKCNYKGLRWSDDQKGQNKWCMTARQKITQAETDARQLLLNACYAEKADTENNKKPLDLPGACRWNGESYQQVRYIFSRRSYNNDPIPVSPIQDGLIKEDLNKDSQPDFIYLERSPSHQFRAILCLSSPSGWKRQPLAKITEDIGPGTSAEFDDMSAKDGKVTLVRNSIQHNTGSNSVIRSYDYSGTEEALLLESEVSEFVSADLFTSSTKTTTDYVKGVIRQSIQCGDLEDACKNEDKTTPMEEFRLTTDKRKFKW